MNESYHLFKSLEAKETWQVVFHASKESLVVPLRADFRSEFKCVHHLLLASLDLFKCIPSFQPHLKIEADHLEDLLVSR